MTIILGKGLKENLWDRRRPNQNRGWVDSSIKTGQLKGQLNEQQYYQSLNANEPLIKYILVNYTKESEFPLLVIGYNALPIAIELSQWTYPVIFGSFSSEETSRAKRDCEIHAGTFKQIIEKDYRYNANFPPARVAIFSGLLNYYRDSDAIHWIKDLLNNSYEILCALPPNRNWYNVFSRAFNVFVIKETKEKWIILKITKK